MDTHSDLEVMLSVTCCNPADVPRVVEKLGHVMAGLALDGMDTRLSVWRPVDVDEEVGP